MATYKIPLNPLPNMSLVVTLFINGANITFILEFCYREVCEYWTMSIKDWNTNDYYVTNIPLLTGGNINDAGNLLEQFKYLNIGRAMILKEFITDNDSPNNKDLGSNFVLLWSDNI